LSPTAVNQVVLECCSRFQAVSKQAETVMSMILNRYFESVSQFHDFWGLGALDFFNRPFPRCLAQLEFGASSFKNSETLQRSCFLGAKARSYPFHPTLKRLETLRNSQHANKRIQKGRS
jgi:hypothetical protein